MCSCVRGDYLKMSIPEFDACSLQTGKMLVSGERADCVRFSQSLDQELDGFGSVSLPSPIA